MTTAIKTAVLALGLVLIGPLAAEACPLCIAAQDKSVQIAYAVASAFMTFLPLGLIGGFVFWVRRRARQIAIEEAAGVIRLPVRPPRSKNAA